MRVLQQTLYNKVQYMLTPETAGLQLQSLESPALVA